MASVADPSTQDMPCPLLPELGLGTYLLKGEVCKQAVADALRLGIRYVDTASQYANEAEVAAAIRESGVPRENLVFSTKIGPRQVKKGYEGVMEACRDSLRLLETDYIDIVLLHWPGVANIALDSAKHATGRREAWRALEDMQQSGKIRHIAVSNFLEKHMPDVKSTAPATNSSNNDVSVRSVAPFLNQIEMHPLCRQRDVVSYCRKSGILVQQYAPVAQCHPTVMEHPVIVAAVGELTALFADADVRDAWFTPATTAAAAAAAAPNPSVSMPLTFHLSGADVCLLWGFWSASSDGLVVRSTNPQHMQRAMDLHRLMKCCDGTLRSALLDIMRRVDLGTHEDATQGCEVGTVASGASDFHTCWHSGLVS